MNGWLYVFRLIERWLFSYVRYRQREILLGGGVVGQRGRVYVEFRVPTHQIANAGRELGGKVGGDGAEEIEPRYYVAKLR